MENGFAQQRNPFRQNSTLIARKPPAGKICCCSLKLLDLDWESLVPIIQQIEILHLPLPYKQSPTFFLFMSPTPASLPGKVGNPMKTKEGKTCDASASIWRRRRWHTQRLSCVLSQNQPLGQICITLSQQWSLSPWGGRNLSLAMRHLAGGPRWGLGTCLPSGNNGGWWPNCLLNCQYNYWGPINLFGHELET